MLKSTFLRYRSYITRCSYPSAKASRDLAECFLPNLNDPDRISMPETRGKVYLASCVAYMMLTKDRVQVDKTHLQELIATHNVDVTQAVLQEITSIDSNRAPDLLFCYTKNLLELLGGHYSMFLQYCCC